MSTEATRALYAELSRPFAEPRQLRKGGTDLDYLDGEQVISHLNDTLGVDGWEFRVRDHGRDEDTVWVLGRLTVRFPDRTIAHEQFGECQVTRGMGSGDARKGAATDCLKKIATLIGVGLWLYDKDQAGNGGAKPKAAAPAPAPRQEQQAPASGDALTCADCGSALTETAFRDGTKWPPSQLAGYGRRKHNRVLCMEHYRAANEARRRAERTMEEVPF